MFSERPSGTRFWSAGGEEIWWAVRSGDWKLVAEKEQVGLFDLSQHVSETRNLAGKMPDEVAQLTAPHDAWLAQMASPVKGGAKRYGLEGPQRDEEKEDGQEAKI